MVGTCLELMKQQQVRRVVAIDERGACIGIVSQADLAGSTGTEEMGEVAASIVQPERPIAST
jgi:predicted transcriptional regulator